jgi:hypothetical protein
MRYPTATFPFLEEVPILPPKGEHCNRAAYNEAVERRHSGASAWVIRDANGNWFAFEDIKWTLATWCLAYLRDPFLDGHNPRGTLTGVAWFLGELPETKVLLDFEDKFQTFFLSRGAITYMTLLIKDIETIYPDLCKTNHQTNPS